MGLSGPNPLTKSLGGVIMANVKGGLCRVGFRGSVSGALERFDRFLYSIGSVRRHFS